LPGAVFVDGVGAGAGAGAAADGEGGAASGGALEPRHPSQTQVTREITATTTGKKGDGARIAQVIRQD